MYSAYFFAGTLNVLIGYFLFTQQDKNQDDADFANDQSKPNILTTNIFRNQLSLIITTVFTTLTAIAKLLAPTSGNVPVIGDIVPVGSLGLLSVVLILRISNLAHSSNEVQQQHQLLAYSKYIGLIAMIVGVAHIFLHRMLFL